MYKYPISLILLSIFFILTQFSVSLYLPASLQLAELFHQSQAAILSILPLFFLGYATGQLFWGVISDKHGRKKPLLSALAIHCLLALVISQTQNYHLFIVMMCLLGFVTSAFTSIPIAIIKEGIPKPHNAQALASVEVVMAFSPIFSMFLGAYITAYLNWQFVFYTLSIISMLLFIATSFKLPETNLITKEIKTISSPFYIACQLISHRIFLTYIIVLGISFGVLMCYLGAAPFIFIKDLHVSETHYAWVFIAATITYGFGTYITKQLLQRFGTKKLAQIGLYIAIIGACYLVLTSTLSNAQLINTLIASAILMLGLGLLLPATKIGAMSQFESHHGMAASLMKCFQTGLCVIFVAISAHSQNHYMAMLSMTTFGLICFTVFYKTKQSAVQ